MKRILGTAVAAVLLVSCGTQQGSEYLGKWVSTKSDKRTLEIERNGESFMVRNSEPSFFSGKVETKNIPATLEDGVLQVSVGFGTISLAIDETSGHLTDGQTEYRRVD